MSTGRPAQSDKNRPGAHDRRRADGRSAVLEGRNGIGWPQSQQDGSVLVLVAAIFTEASAASTSAATASAASHRGAGRPDGHGSVSLRAVRAYPVPRALREEILTTAQTPAYGHLRMPKLDGVSVGFFRAQGGGSSVHYLAALAGAVFAPAHRYFAGATGSLTVHLRNSSCQTNGTTNELAPRKLSLLF